MEKSENEVYSGSSSYCKVGKITAKKYFEEDQSISENGFDKFDEDLSCVML